ncbi:MAG TPA: 3-dehydroquinate synthase II [Candidatus Methanoculleus thermohydrogenotrophicum]|jgi:3-dehydroquinate synthase II|nr:3-dehydroquinate synthase II [Candidatus Methanoculleus thermohydrogenotrophicum]NLM81804.1 3-dehydroquinate synthase II [Candidatus Methanoculleus thermohydrogenotrophicum]HOB17572.1 3-dehydroquinate synthase II [Candidatus Methanoculleus thermohydrogenotrophicum]HPZ37728.1 3-dehydroquinate synthase II [Candidatus Methanoculleus thermohydrogenotrophicum]HQC90831.1 3-dehydroquinate synthase II [Candidatus Methanoculleus thermohydrogenotrophicum]
MKQFWVDVRPWRKDLATTAIESGADALVVDDAERVRELGRVTTVAENGDLVPGKDVFEVEITDKATEEEALRLSRTGYVIVRTGDWTVIPLENLVAQSDQIIAAVTTADEAAVALNVLERGVAGILLATGDPAEIRRASGVIAGSGAEVALIPFEVTRIAPVGMGDRVCVDTCSLLADGEGMLVGNTSSAFLLVHPETLENPYVAPRPFRVNAGAVHAYTLLPDGKTAYLTDLSVGDRVLIAEHTGATHEAVVGRVKIERRPLLLVEAKAGDARVSLVLQNAETIRLVAEDGRPVSVVDLAVGDRVLGSVAEGGRHFGVAVAETILEK